MSKTRRQHYVWRKYLEAWSKGDQIWCLRDKKIFSTNVLNVGLERDFHRLKEISSSDITWITHFIERSNDPSLKKMNKGWINMFSKPFKVRAFLDANKIREPEAEKELEKLFNDAEEMLHSRFESEATKYLESLLNDDTSFFDVGSDCIAFLHFLCLQYMRTKNMQRRQIDAFKPAGDEKMESMWPVLRHVAAMNIATSTYHQRHNFRLILLKNNSSFEFITCDQPVINTYSMTNEATEKFELYYPVSPQRAILLTDKIEFREECHVDVDSDQVKYYNLAMIKAADEQIYASRKEELSLIDNSISD